ncbi:MAG TPA: TetR/AcrR family transcriptional regulator [Dehalococcoidia bacterium]|nr:TetR/AcrR family transcriptional regulator [Dehalococcoidia bacterium]
MPKVSEAYLKARRDQILDAAWTCFGRRGYHETTMQDICKESGLSYGALYRYFTSKEDILRATSERAQSEALQRIAQSRDTAGEPLGALAALGARVFGSLNDPSCDAVTRVHIETLPEALRRPDLLQSLSAELNTWRSNMRALLDEAQSAGQLAPHIDTEGLAVLLICAWEGLRVHHLIDPEHFRPEPVLRAIAGLIGDKHAAASPS